jgi:Flp pilus assembly protein TadD
LDRGDVDGAASHVQEALKLAPRDAAAHELAGRVLEARHDLAGARAEFTTALRLDPSYVPAQEGLRRVR